MNEEECEKFHAEVWGSGQITIPKLHRKNMDVDVGGTVTVYVKPFEGGE